jgi:hypothetical protein
MSQATEMLTVGLLSPTVHSNGTSRGELLDQLLEAAEAVQKAVAVLRKANPNGRDYYPQGADAIITAGKQHRIRIARLEATHAELMAIAEIVHG